MYKINLETTDWKKYYDVMNRCIRNTTKERMVFTKNTFHYQCYQYNYNDPVYKSPIKIGTKNSMTEINKEEYEKIKNSYRSKDDVHGIKISDYVYSMIISAGLQTNVESCPYCSLQTPGFTFEHHLPKASYPEYVLFPLNLIPACNQCNTNVKEKYCDFHPYFDQPDYIYKFNYEFKNNTCIILLEFNNTNHGIMMKNWKNVNSQILLKMQDYAAAISRKVKKYGITEIEKLDVDADFYEEKYGQTNWITQFHRYIISLYSCMPSSIDSIEIKKLKL